MWTMSFSARVWFFLLGAVAVSGQNPYVEEDLLALKELWMLDADKPAGHDPSASYRAPLGEAFDKRGKFSNWGGKRFESVANYRGEDDLAEPPCDDNKRGAFRSWGGKRSLDMEEMDEARRSEGEVSFDPAESGKRFSGTMRGFSNWGGKRSITESRSEHYRNLSDYKMKVKQCMMIYKYNLEELKEIVRKLLWEYIHGPQPELDRKFLHVPYKFSLWLNCSLKVFLESVKPRPELEEVEVVYPNPE